MAKVTQRIWTSRGPTGKRVKHVACGYTLRVHGKKERKFSSAWLTEADALAALSARLKAVDAGQTDRPAERTLGALVEEYLTYKGQHGKRSLTDDARILRRAWLPALGAGRSVRAITAAMIAQYERQRAGQVSPYTVANELGVLRHALRLAKRWGYLTVVPEVTLPTRPKGRLRLGMRKGEILGLEWERVDLSSARLRVVHTKSGEPRGVPINRAVYETLIALEPDQARRVGRCFPNGNDRRGSQIRAAFETALRRAGITGFRFHDLRHTAASHLVMRGASLKDVQEILGHSDLRMTNRYAHLSPAHLRGAVERLEGLTPTGTHMELRPESSVVVAQEGEG